MVVISPADVADAFAMLVFLLIVAPVAALAVGVVRRRR